ncbi:WhiB family transcriptional regulator [Streptomyces olivaceus]|uniref:WhiB family transcriptional regulator n=1 Tax=Streptomyces olivaceus TaxID=47716 RepID=UPI0036E9E6D0
MTGTTWRDHAACRTEDPDLFFPLGTDGTWALQIEQAKDVCRRCPVAEACLTYASAHHVSDGIFGGLTSWERRSIERRKARGRCEPEYPHPATSLAEALERRTTPTDDGHLLWTGVSHVSFHGQRYTGARASFLLAHGREPVGIVRRTCTTRGCVHGEHIADQEMRDTEDVCGSRKGYHRHRARGEDACEACRIANTQEGRRLRATGSTKAAA